MIKADVKPVDEPDRMLHDKFELRLTERVNGEWLQRIINRALEIYGGIIDE